MPRCGFNGLKNSFYRFGERYAVIVAQFAKF